MADGKWIEGLKASTPLAAAARKVLAVRLGAVRDRLRPALTKADEDVEHVHQLRVATRRARAAIDLFENALPGKVHRKARKTLRKIRRGAGEARDWDVFVDELEGQLQSAPAGRTTGLIFLAGYACARRADAQTRLQKEADSMDLGALVKDTVVAIHDAAEQKTLGDLAQPCLINLTRELATAAGKNLEQYERLHEVRILGKRLRYAMEIFVGCYGGEFREKFYPAVEEMQDILGRANDSFTAAQRLGEIAAKIKAARPRLWKEVRNGIEFLRRFHERRLPGQRKQFQRWWKRWKKLNAEEAFARLVDTPAVKRGDETKRDRAFPTAQTGDSKSPAAAPAQEPAHSETPHPAEVALSRETQAAARYLEAPLPEAPAAPKPATE